MTVNTSRSVTRPLGAIALVAGLALGSAAVQAGPASANDGVCGPGDLCLYENTLFGGGRWDDSGYVSDYTSGHKWWGTTRTVQDAASSAKSKYSFWTAYVWEHSFYRGDYVPVPPGGQVSVFADFGMENKASSNNY
ncbi:peptidase inhibitor family I36 protein [Micromonospora sp. C31]|uniref:peptidase inhibitor family I36 protein n=1 Tax=Micromonospora sp. C31 TaxID=2824876 RepID=UPI001B38E22B|nr:peptidase inhibitor family I36 protein [Micromonospora sp. C31]MBQ1072175.1 peptidase inhibitor family I36 protein [Micromonospora sp. C31]